MPLLNLSVCVHMGAGPDLTLPSAPSYPPTPTWSETGTPGGPHVDHSHRMPKGLVQKKQADYCGGGK